VMLITGYGHAHKTFGFCTGQDCGAVFKVYGVYVLYWFANMSLTLIGK